MVKKSVEIISRNAEPFRSEIRISGKSGFSPGAQIDFRGCELCSRDRGVQYRREFEASENKVFIFHEKYFSGRKKGFSLEKGGTLSLI